MEAAKHKSPSETLKAKVVRRAVFLVFGCIGATLLSVVLSVLYFIPVRTVSSASEATQDAFPVGVYIPLVIKGWS